MGDVRSWFWAWASQVPTALPGSDWPPLEDVLADGSTVRSKYWVGLLANLESQRCQATEANEALYRVQASGLRFTREFVPKFLEALGSFRASRPKILATEDTSGEHPDNPRMLAYWATISREDKQFYMAHTAACFPAWVRAAGEPGERGAMYTKWLELFAVSQAWDAKHGRPLAEPPAPRPEPIKGVKRIGDQPPTLAAQGARA